MVGPTNDRRDNSKMGAVGFAEPTGLPANRAHPDGSGQTTPGNVTEGIDVGSRARVQPFRLDILARPSTIGGVSQASLVYCFWPASARSASLTAP